MAANYKSIHILVVLTLLAFATLGSLGHKIESRDLNPNFYDQSCPNAQEIVHSIVGKAVEKESRMAASLLRLHFHDCFVQGCDGSVLLNKAGNITSEKGSNPNKNSIRGFDVVDEIKEALEKACPNKVSCADILALAARDSTTLAGGPNWVVPLGRLDSRNANLSGSNNNIPAPNSTFLTLLDKFQAQGLNITDLVALSGSHTIGKARCVSLKQRLYNQASQAPLDGSYAAKLRSECPRSGNDNKLFPLDFYSHEKFDNSYFKILLSYKGLLNSDQVLTTNDTSMELVKRYADDNKLFFNQFAISMVKMGNIITKMTDGEVRKNCRKINE